MSNPFSEEIPDLLQTHYEHLVNSSISLEVIKERGYRSILGKKELGDLGFSKAQQRCPGLLIPLYSVDGEIFSHQYRPDNPRTGAKGRIIKYENPAGSSIRLDVPPRCREKLGDPSVPLIFTEGVKKDDAAASQDGCVVGLVGVWGFRGKNTFSGTTILADFDYIAFKDRLVYIAFDSDSISNPHVRQAQTRLKEHLSRKGARVVVLQIPPGPDGEKVGVDDYLAQGHTLDALLALKNTESLTEVDNISRKKSSTQYCISENRICWLKHTSDGLTEVPLCNFNASVAEDILKDNGIETARIFKVNGKLANGESLPAIEVPSSSFSALNWIPSEWGMKAIVAAGPAHKDRLREAIQLQSQNVQSRLVYTHTGWRDVNGDKVFLSGSGALDNPDIEIELDPPLQRYQLLVEPYSNRGEAVKSSFDFMLVAKPEVSMPLFTAMYLAPLSELLDPAFTLWIVGPSGSYKSTLSALAISHFGLFDEFHLPASWRDTHNQLEKLSFLAKDVPLVIDDWAPGQDSAKARELEVKAEYIIRAQGNRQGRGRMRPDTSSRPNYIPRGLLITSGEQLPSGHSHTARILSIDVERNNVDIEYLSSAQDHKYQYCAAMTEYIRWLKQNWAFISKKLPEKWRDYRDKARNEAYHSRLPGVIAGLYCGMEMVNSFALDNKFLTSSEVESYRSSSWDIFTQLATIQAGLVENERPGQRFIEVLKAMLDQGKAVLGDKSDDGPRTPAPGTTSVGWGEGEDYILLNPVAAYGAVREFCQRSGEPFTFKQDAVWKDLKRLNFTVCQDGRTKFRSVIYGKPTWIVKLKKI